MTLSAVGPELVINEVYYDHPGTDSGHEFVEFYNPRGDPVALAGVTLRFHNGAGDGWSTLWTGTDMDTVGPRSVFTIGAAEVRPLPDVVTGLSLQNGPDALGLFHGGVALDVVGYGGLDDPDYVETAGVARVSAGRSIARIPDGYDSDHNANDFEPAVPTPGRTNVARHDAVLAHSAELPERAVIEPGMVRIGVPIINGGTEPIAAGTVRLTARDSTASDPVVVGVGSNPDRVAPGEAGRVDMELLFAAGYHWLQLDIDYGPDERDGNNSLELLRRAGTPDLMISEVLSAPRTGCPQFVEVYNAGATVIAIAGYGMRDRTHDPVPFGPPGASIAPASFAVITPDPAVLHACFRVDATAVLPVSDPWPTINRTGGAVADSVVIVDVHGLPVDAVSVPAIPTAAVGRSLERVGLYAGAGVTWILSQHDDGASPGSAGDRALYAAPPPGSIVVDPNPYFPSDGVMTVAIDAPDGARAVAWIFDAAGRRVASLGIATAFPAVLVWSGRRDGGGGVLPGLYILACRISGPGGTRVMREVVACGNR